MGRALLVQCLFCLSNESHPYPRPQPSSSSLAGLSDLNLTHTSTHLGRESGFIHFLLGLKESSKSDILYQMTGNNEKLETQLGGKILLMKNLFRMFGNQSALMLIEHNEHT